MPASSPGRSPGEELIYQQARKEIESELREEQSAQRKEEVATARLALTIVGGLALCAGIPLLALVLGVSVRIFRWASGW